MEVTDLLDAAFHGVAAASTLGFLSLRLSFNLLEEVCTEDLSEHRVDLVDASLNLLALVHQSFEVVELLAVVADVVDAEGTFVGGDVHISLSFCLLFFICRLSTRAILIGHEALVNKFLKISTGLFQELIKILLSSVTVWLRSKSFARENSLALSCQA
jgi:hypothetical protein